MMTGGAAVQIVRPVVEQHVDDLAFLWLLRNAAVEAPHYDLADLLELDQRCAAHLDGVLIAGAPALEIMKANYEFSDSGEVAAMAASSLLGRDREGLQLALGEGGAVRTAGLVAALGWLPWAQAHPFAEAAIVSADPRQRAIGLGAHAAHRQVPKSGLRSFLDDRDSEVRRRALRLVGQLKLREHLPEVQASYRSDALKERFWSAWSGMLLGDDGAWPVLETSAGFGPTLAETIARALPRAMPLERSQHWLRSLASDAAGRRHALIGAGAVGDPVYVPTLVAQAAEPAHARIAGEALRMITGVDLAYEDLDLDTPPPFEGGPTDDPNDDGVALDPDEDLPWPDPQKVERWWAANKQRFTAGQRYLAGRLITEQSCLDALRATHQRQRIGAAYELALLQADEPLFEWRAPAYRQRAVLS